jgi:hypothetical protein
MNRLKKGPELKMPDWKVPTLVGDLFYDLRERRLLPLVGLVLVAIVAVPFLLGDSEEAAPPTPETSPIAGASKTAEHLVVVESKPGLRDYHKRLADQTPTDPFEQRFTGATGGQLSSEVETSSAPPTTESPTTTTTTSGSEPSSDSPSTDTGNTADPDLVLFSFAINVKITRSGGKDAAPGQDPEPVVKKRILPQTALPGDKAPVVTYMGVSRKTTDLDHPKLLLLVSPEVKSVFGDAKCVSGSETCQMLEVEPGFPEVFVYGANEVHYTVNILKAGFVVTGRSDRP